MILNLQQFAFRNFRIFNSRLTSVFTPNFTTFYQQMDRQDLKQFYLNKHKKRFQHYRLTDLWKKPLEKKKRRQERKAILQAQKQPVEDMPPKLVVHNQVLGIEYPPKDDKQFAVIQIDSLQYKVMKDSILFLDTKQDYELNKKITIDKVPLIGTNTFTLLGRPFVNSAKVQAIVESISKCQKVIVFKKNRRKRYRKSMGHRQLLTQCRITNIVYELTDQILSKATKIVQ